MTTWRPIPGWHGFYEASDTGLVTRGGRGRKCLTCHRERTRRRRAAQRAARLYDQAA